MKKFIVEKQLRVHYQNVEAADVLAKEIENNIRLGLHSGKSDVVFVCIGTDRSTGDCLGPLVGHKMMRVESKGFHVYGTLEFPVHAQNLDYVLDDIYGRFEDPFVVAVDACLGQEESVGYICVGKGAIKPGAALNKKLPSVGDMYITGVVNFGGFMDFSVLQGTRLSVVYGMSDKISHSIKRAVLKVQKDKKKMMKTR